MFSSQGDEEEHRTSNTEHPTSNGGSNTRAMGVFAYKALAADASVVDGMIVADTPRDARDSLRARGLTVQQVAPGRGAASAGWHRLLPGSRGAAQAKVVSFLRELSTLLGVGVPLVEAID